MDANTDWNNAQALKWSWSADSAPETKHIAKHFRNYSDAKPVCGTRRILTVCSNGGVALISRISKKVLYAGVFPMYPHSAALLPDGNIVVASSKDGVLTLQCVPDKAGAPSPRKTYELEDAHGCVWDKSEKILWAVGINELRGYEYNFKKDDPELKIKHKLALPEYLKFGHDLFPVPNSTLLFVTGRSCGIFNTRSLKFAKIADVARVKSISMHPETGAIIIQKTKTKWYSDTIHFLDKKQTPFRKMNYERFYKARWFVPCEFSEDPIADAD